MNNKCELRSIGLPESKLWSDVTFFSTPLPGEGKEEISVSW